MKNLKTITINIFVFVLLLSVYNCKENKEPIKPMVLTGQITNPQEDYVIIINGIKSDSIKLEDNGRFVYKPSDTTGRFVGMMLERNLLNVIYLTPGAEVHMEANGEALKKRDISSINFSGTKSDESSFLMELENDKADKSSPYFASKLNVMKAEEFETTYANMMAERSEKYTQFLKDHPDTNTSFIEDLKILNEIDRKRTFEMYPRLYKIFSKDTVPQSYDFKAYDYNIPLDNAQLFNYSIAYSNYVNDYFEQAYEEKYGAFAEEGIEMNTYLDFYQNNTIPEVAERKAVFLMSRYINFPAESRNILKARYKNLVSNVSELERLNTIVESTERLDKGQPAPEIAYPDKDGNIISTKDYAGKVIYIDLWATWCLPCKEEIPFLEKLVEEFKDHDDLVFMSVAIKDNEARWRKMLKEQNMSGLQLYSGNTMNVAINRDYVVNTIPRFLIIGKDGNIIDAFASKPSDPETKILLAQLIEK